jgi:hypothetical protein
LRLVLLPSSYSCDGLQKIRTRAFAFSPGQLFRLVWAAPTTRGIPSQMIQTIAITADGYRSPDS